MNTYSCVHVIDYMILPFSDPAPISSTLYPELLTWYTWLSQSSELMELLPDMFRWLYGCLHTNADMATILISQFFIVANSECTIEVTETKKESVQLQAPYQQHDTFAYLYETVYTGFGNTLKIKFNLTTNNTVKMVRRISHSFVVTI